MKLTLEQWIQYGIDNDYCTREYCDTHDGYPHEDRKLIDELWQYSSGDHCMTVVAIKSGEIEAQLEHYKEEEAQERKRGLAEPVEDFFLMS